MIRAYIRCMTLILDRYNMIRSVEKVTKGLEKQTPIPLQLSGFQAYHPPSALAKERFLKYRPWKSRTHANWVVADLIKKKYLHGDTKKINGTAYDLLCIEDKGRELTDKAFLVIPIGLLNAWYKEFGGLLTFIFGLVTGLLLPVAYYVIRLYWPN